MHLWPRREAASMQTGDIHCNLACASYSRLSKNYCESCYGSWHSSGKWHVDALYVRISPANTESARRELRGRRLGGSRGDSALEKEGKTRWGGECSGVRGRKRTSKASLKRLEHDCPFERENRSGACGAEKCKEQGISDWRWGQCYSSTLLRRSELLPRAEHV
eukprot:6196025-Pleurochrysis_carterae.AAC.1